LSSGSIAEWSTFLAVQAGAAATLSGLVFVAFALNQSRIMAYPGLPGRAAESLLQFLEVFFISTVALIPRQPEWILAAEFLAIGSVVWVAQVIGLVRYHKLREGHPLWWFVLRMVLGQLGAIPFLVAGITVWLGVPGALYWLVPGFIFSFTAGIISAWVLLVEILR
jgi:hypothetical protein